MLIWQATATLAPPPAMLTKDLSCVSVIASGYHMPNP